jgi:hypothetical protein
MPNNIPRIMYFSVSIYIILCDKVQSNTEMYMTVLGSHFIIYLFIYF